jgi:hypothetical protein
MLFLPPSTGQSPDEAAKILSVPALSLAGCTSSPSCFIRHNLSGLLGCKGGVSLHETAELPPFNAIHRHPSPFQPTEEEAAGDLLPLGKNSHTCRTLSTGHNAATCLASSCPIGALTTKAQWPTMSLSLSPIHILC